jgi:hypothetical protein
MTSTTTSAAVNAGTNTVTVASATGITAIGPLNNYTSMIYIDQELMGVRGVSGTTITVDRGRGGPQSAHVSGSTVYVGAPGTFTSNNYVGACTAADTYNPTINTSNGNMFTCLSSGKWLQTGVGGLAGGAGINVTAFCTGAVGTNENDFLNGAACAGATTSTFRYLVDRAGTLANLRVWGSAVVVGGGSDPVTVYVNGVASIITCTVAAAAATCSDLTRSVAVVPGDRITVLVDATASDTFANVTASVGLY